MSSFFASRSRHSAHGHLPTSGSTETEDADLLALRAMRESNLLKATPDAKDETIDFSDVMVKDMTDSISFGLNKSKTGLDGRSKTTTWHQKLRYIMGRQSKWKALTKLASKGEDGIKEALSRMENTENKSMNDESFRDPNSGQNLFHYVLKKQFRPAAYYILQTVNDQQFLVHHFNVTINNCNGKRNAFHDIVKMGSTDLAKCLLRRVTNPSLRQSLLYGETPIALEGQRPRSLPPLLLAASFGHTDLVRFLVEDIKVPVELTNSKKDTALMFASRWNHVDTIRLLISLGADVDKTNDTGATALYWAVRYGHVAAVECLIRDGKCNVNVKRNSGFQAPIILASALGFDAIIKFLLTAGADVDVHDEGGGTALHHAAREGHMDIIVTLLSFGARLDAGDVHGDTALLLAARHGHSHVLKTLITLGADFSVRNHRGEDMWYLAISSDRQDMLKLAVVLHKRLELLYSSKDYAPDDPIPDEGLPSNSQSPLLLAASLGRCDKITTLLELGVESDVTDQSGNNFLHHAALGNHDNVFEMFCPKPLGPNLKNHNGETPLHCACATGSDEAVLALLKCRPSADVRNNKGQTCLHLVHRLKAVTVRNLIDYAIKAHSWTDINVQDRNGNTPLHLAAALASTDVLWEFRVLGCQETMNKDGNTALHLSVREDEHEVLTAMLDLYNGSHHRKSDINAKNAKGYSVLMLAARARQTTNVHRLLELGSDVALQDWQGNSMIHDVTNLTITDSCHRENYLQVLDAVWHNAVKWWCLKHKLRIPEVDSRDYLGMKRDAIIFLTRHVVNNDEMSVLKHACRIGAMHVIHSLLDMPDVTSYIDYEVGVKLYDVTDLVPMTCKSVRPQTKAAHTPDDLRTEGSQKSCLELVVSNRSVHHVSQLLDIMPLSHLQTIYSDLTCRMYGLFMVLHVVYMAIFNWAGISVLDMNTGHPEDQLEASVFPNSTAMNLTATNDSTVAEFRPNNLFEVLRDPAKLSLLTVVPLEPLLIVLYYLYVAYTRCCKRPVCGKRERRTGHRLRRTVRTSLKVIFTLAFVVIVCTSVALLFLQYDHAEYVLAVALGYGWLFTLSFTRVFRPIHCYWSMIQQIFVSDILRFFVLYLFVIIAFTFAFHAVFMGSSNVKVIYENPFSTMFYVFNLMLGMSDVIEDGVEDGMEESGKGILFIQLLYSVYMITAHIVLLNLLIAMMSDSYSAIRELQEVTWKVEVVQMGLELANSVPFCKYLSRRMKLAKGTLTSANKSEQTVSTSASLSRPSSHYYSSIKMCGDTHDGSKRSDIASDDATTNQGQPSPKYDQWILAIPLEYDQALGRPMEAEDDQDDVVSMQALMDKMVMFENKISDQIGEMEHALHTLKPKRRFFWMRKSVLS